MRVRVNFTVEFDPEDYREAQGSELSKEEIRAEIQEHAQSDCVLGLSDMGVPVKVLATNNVYDPVQRLTVASHLVKRRARS